MAHNHKPGAVNVGIPVANQPELPPNDEDVEYSALGFILNYPNIYEIVKDRLNEDSFYSPYNRAIYKFIKATADKGVLPSTNNVQATISTGNLTVDGCTLTCELATAATHYAGVDINHTISALAELRKQRKLREFASKIKNQTTEDPESVLNEVQGIINEYDFAKDGEFADMLVTPTEESLDQKFKETEAAYKTKYIFKKGAVEYPLMIPSGAITFIAAPTSHGKSSLLRCLALDMAKEEQSKAREEQGAILYFSFEEDDTDVIAQMMNTYIGLDFTCPNKDYSHGNLASLKEYLKNGKMQFIRESMQDEVGCYAESFKMLFLYSGILRVFYKNYDSTRLIKALDYLRKKIKVKAVFIDYVQMLQMEGKNGKVARTEELKAICSDLKDFAVRSKLPVICASQLNREGAKSPLDMRPQNMSESSDIEKIANVIVCMYNSDHKPDNSSDYEKRASSNEAIQKNYFTIGSQQTKIYAVIAKNRGGIIGGEAVFDFNGNTGEIRNNAEGESKQPKKPINPAIASFGKPKAEPKEACLHFDAPDSNQTNSF